MKKTKIHIRSLPAEQLQDFLDGYEIAIEADTTGPCDVTITTCDDRRESDLQTIYSGGRIACQTALALAKKLHIPVSHMGKMLDHLDVKIHNCGLGCFK